MICPKARENEDAECYVSSAWTQGKTILFISGIIFTKYLETFMLLLWPPMGTEPYRYYILDRLQISQNKHMNVFFVEIDQFGKIIIL